jgi:hypothetical protein
MLGRDIEESICNPQDCGAKYEKTSAYYNDAVQFGQNSLEKVFGRIIFWPYFFKENYKEKWQ